MQKKFEIRFVRAENQGPMYRTVYSKRVRSEKCALRIAGKLRDRHLQTTRYQAHSRDYVEVANLATGECDVLDPVLVPSIGELGYW